MKKRILSILLALALLCGSMAGLGMTAAAADADFGWDAMQGDFAMRVTQNGSEVTRLIVGETYQLQVWMQNIGPYGVMLPIGWNPDVVQIVDRQSGTAITSGRKRAGEKVGFEAGGKCYDSSWDPYTYETRYWNGVPMYTTPEEESEGGYPYLDAENGCYKLFYYILSPHEPAEAQLILELTFRIISRGELGFHIASEDTDAVYDEASPEGITTLLPDGKEVAKTVVYGTDISIPATRVMTRAEYDEEATTPIDPDDLPWVNPPTDEDLNPDEIETLETASMISAQHLKCFPYSSQAEVSAVVKNIGGVVTNDCDYIVPSSVLSKVLNSGAGDSKRSILVKMPSKIIDKQEYTLVFSMEVLDDMAAYGLSYLYAETPWGYVGLNTAILAAQTQDDAQIELQVKPRTNGLSVHLRVDGRTVRGFTGMILRVILPYDGDGENVLVTGTDVFGTGAIANQPLNLCTVDTSAKAVIFQSPSFCGFDVTTGSAASFTDLAGASWAEESIQTLVKKNVLSGVGGGKFAPNNAVTREQYVKMLVCTLGMYKASETTQVFTDVPTSNYFHPYLASAKAAGISNGQSGGKFGIKQTITRQDLVVMTYRALSQMGLVPEAVRSVTTFADDAQISSYAKEAVYALYAAGIIDGMGANTFAPTKTATRAQAAKIMAGVLQLTQEAL